MHLGGDGRSHGSTPPCAAPGDEHRPVNTILIDVGTDIDAVGPTNMPCSSDETQIIATSLESAIDYLIAADTAGATNRTYRIRYFTE